jgi:hypothetical protein
MTIRVLGLALGYLRSEDDEHEQEDDTCRDSILTTPGECFRTRNFAELSFAEIPSTSGRLRNSAPYEIGGREPGSLNG